MLLIAATAGMGKTSCALWLARKTRNLDRVWLFVSLPSVHDPFGPNSLIRHLETTFGFREQETEELRHCPLVLILDSLDEVARAAPPVQRWWELNGFAKWNVKLIVTCRQENVGDYGQCLGDPTWLYLQGFGEEQMEAYVGMRMALQEAPGPAPAGALRFGETTAARQPRPAPAGAQDAGAGSGVGPMMAQIRRSPIRRGYAVPFRLSMGMDLAGDDPDVFRDVARASELYARWLRHFLRQRGAADGAVEEEVGHAERLAWDLHQQGRTHARVGDRGVQGWFRRCPLRVHDFHPDSHFSFKHKSIQEFLVATHLYRLLTAGDACAPLSGIHLARDFAVLRFFGDLCLGRAAADPEEVAGVHQRLLANVAASRGAAAAAACAANSVSLLNAARVPLAGQDLRGAHLPGANLQCANLYQADLREAVLTGADLRGAVLDKADLRGADLTDVVASELRRTLSGHTGPVCSVAVSPDGGTVASASYDTTVRVWCAGTGEVRATLRGHLGSVRAVAFAADGAALVSGCDDSMVRVFDAATGTARATLRGHTGKVCCVVVASDGRTIVSGSDDETVRLWGAETGDLLRTLEGPPGGVYGVAISRDGASIAAGTDEEVVYVWDVAAEALRNTLKGHTGTVNRCCARPAAHALQPAPCPIDGWPRVFFFLSCSVRPPSVLL